MAVLVFDQDVTFEEGEAIFELSSFRIKVGRTYRVTWGQDVFECVATTAKMENYLFTFIGNTGIVDGIDNGIPFIIATVVGQNMSGIISVDGLISQHVTIHNLSLEKETLICEIPQTEFWFNSTFGCYGMLIEPAPFYPIVGNIYKVIWKDSDENITEWDCIGLSAEESLPGVTFIGSMPLLNFYGNGEHFIIGGDGSSPLNVLNFVDQEAKSHSFSVYSVELSTEENEPDGIVIKNPLGEDVVYGDYKKIRLNKKSGIKVIYSEGEAIENVPIELNFSNGTNQIVSAPNGYLVKSAIILKPDDLIPDNIIKGVEIGGVEGALIIPQGEEITITPDFSEGNIEFLPNDDYMYSKVTVQKPDTLIPENIVKGVVIAGIEGTNEGGGGSVNLEGDFLRYVIYQLDNENMEIVLYKILYDKLYAETGSYDVSIPDKFGSYNVVINAKGA